MENGQQTPSQNTTDGDSLEAATGASATTPALGVAGNDKDDKKAPKKKKGPGIFARFSVYLLLFGFIVILAVMIVTITYLKSHSKSNLKINSQDLNQSALSQLAQSDVTVGDAKQVLNVQSNAVFAGQVLVRSDLQVAGKLQVGGSLSLTGITVSGSSIFDQIQVNKNLQVAGDTALQGQLTIAKSLSVNGGGTFNGPISTPQLTAGTLQISGDLNLTHHITAGGVNPGRSNGNALGGGGTTSVSGSDTAGSITINTGGSPSAGCFITVNFAQKFNSTPHVVVTPIGSAAGGLAYYVNRNTASFSVCTNSAAPAGASFGFDYIVFD